MDRNTIIGLLLIFGILIGYSLWNRPSEEERAAAQRRQDSIAAIQQQRMIEDSIRQVLEAEIKTEEITDTQQETLPTDTAIYSNENVDHEKHGVLAEASVGEDQVYTLENKLLKLQVSSKGGRISMVEIKPFQTYDSLPLVLFDPERNHFGLTFLIGNRLVNTEDYYFKPYLNGMPLNGQTHFDLGSNENLQFSMRLHTFLPDGTIEENSYVEYVYTLKKDDYMMDFDVNFRGMSKYMDQGLNYVDLHWKTELQKLEKSKDRFNGPTIYYKHKDEDVEYLSETKDDEEEISTKLDWVSFKHRFFSSTLIAKDHFVNANINAITDEARESADDHYLRTMQADIGLPYTQGTDNSIPMSLYFGPNKFKVLRTYEMDLERQIPIGWSFFLMAWINRYAVIPVFNFLEGMGWNYGLIILVLTIILKIVLFPIAYRSYKSGAKMRVLRPDIEKLGEKYPKKEDAMKKQQATMALYKSAGVNPAAGCVPMLLQFPILLAMFRFFPSAFELRQKSFLWADDLSSYDSILDLGFNIPLYGDHVSLFTLLMTISTIMYTRVNQEMMGSTNQQLPGMKTMMYLMPIMFLGIFNNYASGLSYYYFLANIITFGQMFLIRKTINEKKIRQQIEINKKKPKKKSNWQKRLEDAAKQRGR